MFNIAQYLQKFVKMQGDAIAYQDAISASLAEVCKVTKAKYETKKGILYIKASPMERMQIFTKKAAVIAAIKAKAPLTEIYDIR